MGMPLLVGAGLGAAGSAITGGNPFKGALLGGAGGALTGGVSSLLGGGSFLEGAMGASNPLSSQVVASRVAPNLTSAGAFESSMGLPSGAMYEAGATGMAGANTLGSMGLQYNPATGSYMSAEEIAKLEQTNPALWEKIKPYITPQNMIGAANIASQFQPKPYQMSAGGGGGVQRGSFSPPSQPMVNVGIPERKKTPFLLG